MVVAVRCPNPGCRKYMLVEDAEQGAVVACLICKRPMRVPPPAGGPSPEKQANAWPPTAQPVGPASRAD